MTTLSLPPTDDDGPLAGSVKPYRRHLAICTGGPAELWAARVEEMAGLFSALDMALVAHGLAKTVKVTATDATSTSAEGFDIFLLPDMLVLRGVTAAEAEPLAAALQRGGALPGAVGPMAPGAHLFVCVHGNRDARCGEWGAPLHAALGREIAAQGVAAHLHQTSHIGGHRFAATAIVYPEGLWYGNLRPDDAPRLVSEHLRHGRWLPDRYRGRLGASPCAQAAEAEALRVLTARYPTYDALTVEVAEAGRRATATATATVPTASGPLPVRADFTLSCPLVWWTADDEPRFAGEGDPSI